MDNITPNNLQALPTTFVSKKGKPIAIDFPQTHKGSEIDSKALVLKTEEEKATAERIP